jgi:putative SOS response-associated peptidase YedK
VGRRAAGRRGWRDHGLCRGLARFRSAQLAIVTVAPDDLSGPDDLPAVVPLALSPAEQERWLTQEWSKAEALVRPLHPDRIRPLACPEMARSMIWQE